MDAQNITPRFEFGFGLSYTSFTYSALSLSQVSPTPNAASNPTSTAITLKFRVLNTGRVVGTEIPQVYLGFPSEAGEPKKVLRGFEEVLDLQPNEEREVSVSLNARDLRYGLLSFFTSSPICSVSFFRMLYPIIPMNLFALTYLNRIPISAFGMYHHRLGSVPPANSKFSLVLRSAMLG